MVDRLLLGNSIEVIKKIDTNSIHAIISDIPYGIGYDDWDVLHENSNSAFGGTSTGQIKAGALFKRRGKPLNGWSGADKRIPLEYQQWCSKWAADWLRVLMPGASCFIFAGRRYAHRCITALEDVGFTFKDLIAWEKKTAPQRAQRISSIYNRRGDEENARKWEDWRVANLRPLFEPILWFQKPYKTGGTIANNVLNYQVGAWNEKALENYNGHSEKIKIYSNIIKVKVASSDRGKHVTQKPLSLMECLIELVTIKGQIVLDPFMGSGTTCLAARKLERHYIGIEANEAIFKVAQKRINEPWQIKF